MPRLHSTDSQTPDAAIPRGNLLRRLSESIEHAAHLLPAQGPITVFIHHNTLHAFEHRPFHEAVNQAAQIFGCHPYLPKAQYREALQSGRIRFDELKQVLKRDLGQRADEPIACFGSRFDLYLAMLQDPLRSGPAEELLWFVAETDALRRVRPEVSAAVRSRLIAETRRWTMRDLRGGGEAESRHPPEIRNSPGTLTSLRELLSRFGEATIESWSDETWECFTLQALWRVCCDGVRDLPSLSPPPATAVRHRDWLLQATGEDGDLLVNALLIRFTAAFLDQGVAQAAMPLRKEGFYRAFSSIYGQPLGSPERWLRGLPAELRRIEAERLSPLESVLDSLEQLGVHADEWDEFLSATLLALRGWGGMLRQIETHSDRVVVPVPSGSLVEFLAIRLLLDRLATAHVAHTAMRFEGCLGELRDTIRRRSGCPRPPSVEERAFLVFQLAQVLGLSPDALHRLQPGEWAEVMREIETFGSLERRRIFHLAYEQRLATAALDAISIYSPQHKSPAPLPAFQVVCCLDEREESFRRHLEEVSPQVETFGAAGFFGLAMYYRGANEAHFRPLCPITVRPRHRVVEDVTPGDEVDGELRAKTRRLLGMATHRLHRGSRSVGSGTLLAGGVGVLATFPLVARILFPRLAARIRKTLGRVVQPPRNTRLRLERRADDSAPENGHAGFTVEEMTDAAERLLHDIGLTADFARLLLLVGHGSNSLNNPYNSAYNCGACGGSAGGPNARAMAAVLNDPRVRAALNARGLELPQRTVAVGAYHNTCNETVTFFDLDEIPSSHRAEFEQAQRAIEAVCDRNAHERCRRFMSAPLTLTFAEAREHVEERAEDLAQTRPELGHATNALTIIGRRERTRGLFLDRRAFLASYDPTRDDAECTVLVRVLQAVFPVCAGINLEYYFSKVDNFGFGSGSKLPHNLAAMLGVMDGAASDLRTGLPWQMVEIHEPVRSLFIIETRPEDMLTIIDRCEGIGRMCRNGWVQLAVLHPETQRVSVFRGGVFEPYEVQAETLPRATSSVDWYRGCRDHLEFCQVANGAEPARRFEPSSPRSQTVGAADA
ncbi:MAG TPA: DUF2309 domain-containing protein [Pirellulales bacterium]|nr:DUF2309 domain-containing protein [Pirellulales bacterium]